jgi:ribosomal protein L11 methyltransferase
MGPDYTKVEIEFLSNEKKELLIAILSENNYHGFEEEGDLLKAYIGSGSYDPATLNKIASHYNFSFSATPVENKNWNEIWESNFPPIVINHPRSNSSWVAIRADFHEPICGAEHEIIITPKMSFGTGHHPSTLMMIEMMSELNFGGTKVLDFGTGTGILAILAEKLGASAVVAIDHDDQSIKNAAENFKSNHCETITLLKNSSARTRGKFNIILANIIKSVIIDNLAHFAKQLSPNGVIVLGGMITQDQDAIAQAAEKHGLNWNKKIEKDNWICLQLHNKLNTAGT